MNDPFAEIPAADPDEIVITRRSAKRQKPRITTLGTTEPPKRKKKTDLNPHQRDWFAKHGWVAGRVDKANAWGAVTQDFWKCADWLASHAEHPALLVQTTSLDHISHRLKKAEDFENSPELRTWTQRNWFEIHGFWQPKGKGTPWHVKRVRVRWTNEAWEREEVE